LEMVLAEGKNREVRRMLAKLGHKVMSLTRVAVGPIALKGLKPGQFRFLTVYEVDLLKKAAAGLAVPSGRFGERRERERSPHTGRPAGPGRSRPGVAHPPHRPAAGPPGPRPPAIGAGPPPGRGRAPGVEPQRARGPYRAQSAEGPPSPGRPPRPTGPRGARHGAMGSPGAAGPIGPPRPAGPRARRPGGPSAGATTPPPRRQRPPGPSRPEGPIRRVIGLGSTPQAQDSTADRTDRPKPRRRPSRAKPLPPRRRGRPVDDTPE
jgi:23S rRNA pseudouridine2605 synthase